MEGLHGELGTGPGDRGMGPVAFSHARGAGSSLPSHLARVALPVNIDMGFPLCLPLPPTHDPSSESRVDNRLLLCLWLGDRKNVAHDTGPGAVTTAPWRWEQRSHHSHTQPQTPIAVTTAHYPSSSTRITTPGQTTRGTGHSLRLPQPETLVKYRAPTHAIIPHSHPRRQSGVRVEGIGPGGRHMPIWGGVRR